MMTNLFSAFDPATSMSTSMNWMSTFICLMIMPYSFWALPNRFSIVMQTIMIKLHQEFKMLIGSTKGTTLLFISLCMYIMINNMMGLLPYIFTSTSHMTFTMSMALPMWISLMLFGWINKTQHMFSHLIPTGTPPILMPFMVCIETISNIIRPGALAVRLSANMIAGHLLMSLLGNSATEMSTIMIIILMSIQMVLMLFETAVAVIQAYVFSILSTLYTSEVAYENIT